MDWLADALLAVMSLLLLLLFGAVVELHRQVHQIRQYVGLVDRSVPIEFVAGSLSSDIGLGFEESRGWEPSNLARNALLILSDSCATCNDIAISLPDRLGDPRLRVVLEARSAEEGQSWLSRHGIGGDSKVSVDHDGRLARALGVEVTPALVKSENLRATAAMTVPTVRTLDVALAWVGGAATEPTAKRHA